MSGAYYNETDARVAYISVASGIEAATVAWRALGWRAIAFAEIEPFPSAVLAHHYPAVPNLGDLRTIAVRILRDEIEAPDVLVAGTPCQAFSVAGNRESLNDDRGNLTLAFAELLDAIDTARVRDGKPACVAVWENVPGVLSTHDNAFGCFLARLAGEDAELQPAGRRWSNAGYVLGPRRRIAWRTLDAQYFGLAQRRRRVFVVASARAGFDPAEVLFEWQGLRRDTPPRRGSAENVAGTVAAGLGSRRGVGQYEGSGALIAYVPDVAGTLMARSRRGGGQTNSPGNNCNSQLVAYGSTIAVHGTQSPCVGDIAFALGRNSGQENAICFAQNTRDEVREMAIAGALAASPGMKQQSYVRQGTVARRLTPLECERLQGFPDDYTLIPWRKRPAEECPDGPRYKAVGNSMAVPCMHWIGSRIDAALFRQQVSA